MHEVVNCQTCGTGKAHWLASGKCPACGNPRPTESQVPAAQLAYDIRRHAEMLLPATPEQFEAMLRIQRAMQREAHLFPYWHFCDWDHGRGYEKFATQE